MHKGVYCLTFPNGKKYVGVGCSNGGVEHRWGSYRILRCKDQPKLYNALKKYGPENVIFEILLETDDPENAKRSEMYLIDVWNLQNDKFGYNISCGGESGNRGLKIWESKQHPKGNLGKHHSDETKKRVSEKFKGRPSPWTSGLNNNCAKIIKIKNRLTGEIKEGLVTQLARELKFHHPNLLQRGHTKNWILIDYSEQVLKNIVNNCKKKIIRSDGKIYNSIVDASRDIKRHPSSISTVIKGKTKSCGGYGWEYYNEKVGVI